MATTALPPEDLSLDALPALETEEIETEDGRLLLPFSFAKRHGLLVHGYEDGQALTLVRNDADPASLSETRRFIDCPLRTEIVTPEVFDARITEFYERESKSKITMVDGLGEDDDLFRAAQELPEPSDLLESDDDAPIIRLINAVLTSAVKDNASDIHIEPFENRLVVRFRIDGVLREVLQSRRAVAPLIVSRIKVMSKLDIAEKRLPQDGRISLRIAGRAVDVRVSTMPSGHGERVVLRLLDKQPPRVPDDDQARDLGRRDVALRTAELSSPRTRSLHSSGCQAPSTSLNPTVAMVSPEASFGSHFACCSALPPRAIASEATA